MNEQLLRTLVRERIFLREGRDIEQLVEQQLKVRPCVGMISVFQGNQTLPQNMRHSQSVASNSGKEVLPIQLFHTASQSVVIVMFTDASMDAWLQKYLSIVAARTGQPGYIFINANGVKFHQVDGTSSSIAESYSGTLDEIERFSNWIVPEFVVDGYIDNSMSFKQQMDQKYL